MCHAVKNFLPGKMGEIAAKKELLSPTETKKSKKAKKKHQTLPEDPTPTA